MSAYDQGLHALISGDASAPSKGIIDQATQAIIDRTKQELLPWAIGGIVLTIIGVGFTSWLICHRTSQ